MSDEHDDDILTKLKQGIRVPNEDFPMESTPRERRRYAILQAAATVVAGHWPYIAQRDIITDILGLLEEIERRETQK